MNWLIVDEIIKNVKRNKFHKEVEALLKKQKKLELSLNQNSLDKDRMKEVELEIMNISLEIVDIQKSLKSLKKRWRLSSLQHQFMIPKKQGAIKNCDEYDSEYKAKTETKS